MTVHGNFTQLTYTNGSGVAINDTNLNASQAVVKITDTELARSLTFSWEQYKELFFNCSTRTIDTFSDYTQWSETGTLTKSEADHTECMIHGRGVKMLEPDNSAGELAIYDSAHTQLNLATFESGDTAAAADLICLLVYISDTTYITRITMRFGTDTSNYYYYDKTTGLVNGWNIITVPKSSFSTFGSISDWTAIDYMAYRALFAANAINQYVIWNHCALVRADGATATLMNPFVANDNSNNWDVDIMTPSSQFLVYEDEQLEEICITDCLQSGVAATSPDFLGCGFVCSSFTGSFRMVIKSTTYSQGIMWYVDDDNCILFQFDDGDVQITERYSGTTYFHYVTPSGTILVGSTVVFKFEKVGGSTARMWITDESESFIFVEVSTEALNFADSDEGELGIGAKATSNLGTIQDFVVTNRRIDQLKLPKLVNNNIGDKLLVRKSSDESRNTTTTQTVDSELFLRLKPFALYKITSHIYAYGQAAADIAVSWSVTGDVTLSTYKGVTGSPTGLTDVNSTEVRRQAVSTSNTVDYGLISSDTTWIEDVFFVTTDDQGGMLNFRWAQDVSNGDNIYVREGSFILAEKIENNY